MAYKSLYRKYRPTSFEEVIGQEHIVVSLKNAIARNQLAHAYLFTGPRGTGKTTLAKLLAKGVNCLHPEKAPCNNCSICESINNENHPDIIEIDAASNNGVDDVRDLIERVKYAPLEATKKVYIIDEVHMLSQGAFNALLKTLEEPPEHVIFVLATTEIHKVLPTIISRCQRYDFTRVSTKDIVNNLNKVLSSENIEAEKGVVESIALLANGGHRDSLTILEQLIAYSNHPITLKDISTLYRVNTPQDKALLVKAILNDDTEKSLELLYELENQSIDYSRYLFDFINLCKEALVYSKTKNEDSVTELNLEVVKELVDLQAEDCLFELMNELVHISEVARLNNQYQIYLEVLCLNLIKKFNQEVLVEEHKAVNEVVTPETKSIIKEVKKENVTKPVKLETNKPVLNNITIKPETLDESLLIQLMVLGDKKVRENDHRQWQNKESYLIDSKFRRLSHLLTQSMIGVSNEEFITLVTQNDAQVFGLKDELNHKLLYDLVIELIGKRKIFLTDSSTFSQTTQSFIQKMKEKTLPTKDSITIDFSIEENNANTQKESVDTVNKLQEFFQDITIED